ncbi:unnamed protein product [Auanema sp. JU1783]|nr:unnamed protein product [Auanema sp. JU1783]
MSEATTSSTASPSTKISFRYVWITKIAKRPLSPDESVILVVSPKFATVYDHISFQWSMKIHGTTGKLTTSDDEQDEEDFSPINYAAVDLYFAEGPVSQIDIRAVVGINRPDSENDETEHVVEEKKSITMYRGKGAEITDKNRAAVSHFIMENVERPVKISVLLKMDAKLFEPFTYLDSVNPTPQKSFLTTNYNARVNSKIWRRKSKRRSKDEDKLSKKEKIDYEKKFEEIMQKETLSCNSLRVVSTSPGSRRSSCTAEKDHDHVFKKILIACCDSCDRRRSSFLYESKTEDEAEDVRYSNFHFHAIVQDGETSDEDQRCFECTETSKEHIHDLLANIYFTKVVLPEMEYVEDFVDFLIDAELNDLPVLKRACERYLCGELNTKKDLVTSLVLDLLFLSIVFNLPVMKSMTLSELSRRTDELKSIDRLMEQEEYKNLDKRIKSLSDRNLMELVEQCMTFKEQRNRVKTIILS